MQENKNKRILIIEDDNSIAQLEKDYLEINGYEVTICDNGTCGIEKIREKGVDLVILDIMLPGLDGFEILKHTREETDIPILVVSAKKEDIDKIRGFGYGADDYITKPFSPGELIARVKAHFSKYDRLVSKNGEKDEGKSINIRGLEIQTAARRVFINNKEVNLAQKEFDLLFYMAKNPNRVFGKEELFEKIWGADALGDTATVTVHVARIREKIEMDTTNPQYIEHDWGSGYRMRG